MSVGGESNTAVQMETQMWLISPGVHIECKRVERLNILDAIAQAVHDAKDGLFPAVFHRRNRSEWLVTMRLSDWIEIYREWEAGRDLNE